MQKTINLPLASEIEERPLTSSAGLVCHIRGNYEQEQELDAAEGC